MLRVTHRQWRARLAGAAGVAAVILAAAAPSAAGSVLLPHPSTTAIGCSPASVRVGMETVCSVTVTAGSHPTGTIQVHGSAFGFPGACTLAPIGGNQARCTTRFVPGQVANPEQVVASYSGDAMNDPSIGWTDIAATRAFSTASVSCAPGSVTVGTATTCTVTVSAFEPSGSVSFFMNESGTFSASSCTFLMIGAGQVSCSVTYTPRAVESGAHKIYAKYSGDMGTLPSNGSTTVAVS